MSKRGPAIAAILLIAVVLGAVREFLFLNLNYEIDHVQNHRAVSYAHSLFRGAVEGWSLLKLVNMKWVLAVSFTGFMLVLSILFARTVFGDHRYRNTLIVGFTVIGSVALFLHLGAAIHPAFGTISIRLLHMLQFPIVLLFLWAAALLQRKTS